MPLVIVGFIGFVLLTLFWMFWVALWLVVAAVWLVWPLALLLLGIALLRGQSRRWRGLQDERPDRLRPTRSSGNAAGGKRPAR